MQQRLIIYRKQNTLSKLLLYHSDPDFFFNSVLSVTGRFGCSEVIWIEILIVHILVDLFPFNFLRCLKCMTGQAQIYQLCLRTEFD